MDARTSLPMEAGQERQKVSTAANAHARMRVCSPSPRSQQIAWWLKVAPAVGCKPLIRRLGVPRSGADWFDHGFIGELEDGQRVLVGEPYMGHDQLAEVAAFAKRYGLRFRAMPGAWSPGWTFLLVFVVEDAAAAVDLFNGGGPQIFVPQPGRFLPRGVKLPQANAERRRRLLAELTSQEAA